MTNNQLCSRCVRDCKQPRSVSVVSCPAFEPVDKNLELFDLKGNIRARSVETRPSKRKPAERKPGPGGK